MVMKHHSKFWIVRISCIIIVGFVLTSATYAQVVVFHNANVIDGTGDDVLHDAVVVVDNSTITCVGKLEDCNDYTNTDETEWVDLSGHWVIPGLIDLHFHLVYEENPDFSSVLRAGVTTVQETGPTNASDDGEYEIGHGQVERLAELADRIERGEILGPRMQYCGPQMFSIDEPYDGIPRMLRLRSGDDISEVVNYMAERGASCIKLISRVSPEHMKDLLTAASERGLRGLGHSTTALSIEKQLSFPWSQIHHFWIPPSEMLPAELRERLPENSPLAHYHAGLSLFDPDTPETLSFVEKVAATDIAWVPTLAAADAFPWGLEVAYWWDLIHQEATAGDSLLIHEALVGSDFSSEVPVDTLDVLHRPFVNFATTLTRMLFEAGVPILAGSDSNYGSASYILQDELEYLVTAGLTPMDAIMAATSRAAKAIGMEHQIGTIEPGNLADFVVLEKNPLDDIRNIRSVRKVVLNGNILTSLIGQPEEKN
jgi:hypothetical protein